MKRLISLAVVEGLEPGGESAGDQEVSLGLELCLLSCLPVLDLEDRAGKFLCIGARFYWTVNMVLSMKHPLLWQFSFTFADLYFIIKEWYELLVVISVLESDLKWTLLMHLYFRHQ